MTTPAPGSIQNPCKTYGHKDKTAPCEWDGKERRCLKEACPQKKVVLAPVVDERPPSEVGWSE